MKHLLGAAGSEYLPSLPSRARRFSPEPCQPRRHRDAFFPFLFPFISIASRPGNRTPSRPGATFELAIMDTPLKPRISQSLGYRTRGLSRRPAGLRHKFSCHPRNAKQVNGLLKPETYPRLSKFASQTLRRRPPPVAFPPALPLSGQAPCRAPTAARRDPRPQDYFRNR